MEDLMIPTIILMSKVGYAISVISLLFAFITLASIKKLRCPRNVLHLHLFASFLMRGSMTLFIRFLSNTESGEIITTDDGVFFVKEPQNVNWSCRTMTSVWNYCILANYYWMLMEGFYLHNVIFHTLFTVKSSIRLYILFGWGVPIIFIIPWALCRLFLDNHFCWRMNENRVILLLIDIPITVSIIASSILFMRVVVFLYLRIRASMSEETKFIKRWAMSTLFLVPLFGFHYCIFLGLQWSESETVKMIWLFCDQLFVSFNGFLAALLYCFLNDEVRTELSKKWNRFSLEELLSRIPGGCFPYPRLNQPQNHPRSFMFSNTPLPTVNVLLPEHCYQPTRNERLSHGTPPQDAPSLNEVSNAEEDGIASEHLGCQPEDASLK